MTARQKIIAEFEDEKEQPAESSGCKFPGYRIVEGGEEVRAGDLCMYRSQYNRESTVVPPTSEACDSIGSLAGSNRVLYFFRELGS